MKELIEQLEQFVKDMQDHSIHLIDVSRLKRILNNDKELTDLRKKVQKLEEELNPNKSELFANICNSRKGGIITCDEIISCFERANKRLVSKWTYECEDCGFKTRIKRDFRLHQRGHTSKTKSINGDK